MAGRLGVWIRAARPRTLPAALAPVAMGLAVASRDGVFHLGAALATLAAALLIQVGTNYANDYFDGVKGTDTATRLGPTRAVQAGLVAPRVMLAAFLVTFVLAVLVGIYLVARGGWPIVAIGATSILFGVLYTGGPRPLGYLGLGDVLVLIFFGPVASGGTYYLQGLGWSNAAWITGLGPGLLAVGLLTVNNLRDIAGDRVAGKRTLAARFGPRFAQAEFVLCLLGAALVPVVLVVALDGPRGALAASATCLLGLPALRSVLRWSPGERLTTSLASSGRLLAVYALAFCLGWIL